MINRYLKNADLFVLTYNESIACVAVVSKIDENTVELKNIVTKKEYRGKGYGKKMLKYLADNYKVRYKKMIVGTSENNIPFYVKQGFDKYEKTIKNFFTDNYDEEEIKEGNLICTDMFYYSKDLKKKQNVLIDSIKLIEYIYENYTPVNIKTIVDEKFDEWCNINKKRITIEKAKTSTIDISYNNLQNDIVVVKKRDLDNITVEINSIFNMQAPVEANTIIGTLKVKVKDEIIDTEDVCIKNEILKKDIRDYFIKCIKSINRF